MKVIYAPRAERRLLAIQAYISRHNPAAAESVLRRIRRSARRLELDPRLGRDWDGRTRALFVPGSTYRIHYRIDEAAGMVEILTVAHTSQRPPRLRRE